MSDELTVEALAKRAATLSRDEFTAEMGPWVLIGPPAALEKSDGWSYATRHAAAAVQTTNPFGVLSTNVAYPLRAKDRRAAVGSSILIGRTETNDVCIPDQSVSKLHARVTKKRFELSDADSTNGTFVNGRKLSASESVPLAPNLLVRFGDRAFQVHASAQLHGVLQTLSRR
jgi:pSer/pThr/pTyr-binding forkhead associated (FHA) protein